MPKISALPPMTTPDGDDEAPVVDDSVGSTKKFTLTLLKEWLQSLTGWIGSSNLDLITTTDANGWDIINLGSTKIYTKRLTGVTTASTSANGLANTTGGGGAGQTFPVGVAPADANWLVDGQTTDGGGRWKFIMDNYTPASTNPTDTWTLVARNMTTATITMTGGTAMIIGISRA